MVNKYIDVVNHFQDLYESIDKKFKLENLALKDEGIEMTPENIRYKQIVDGMAKHIVYGNICVTN